MANLARGARAARRQGGGSERVNDGFQQRHAEINP